MSILTRLIAVYLALVAAAVAVNFIITPLYHPGGDAPFPVWAVLNWFMAAGIIITVITTFLEKRSKTPDLELGDANADLKRYLEVNTVFYGAVVVFILYFWNWFSLLDPDNSPDGQFWVVIDTLMPIVMGVAGCRLWRNASS